MDFNSTKPIYLQIVELIYDRIASEVWRGGERIPSVRELGANLEVNPNTVMRAYEWLESRDIIYNKRGIGFFVNINAHSVITNERRQVFIEEDIPSIAQKIRQLGIPMEEFINYLTKEGNK